MSRIHLHWQLFFTYLLITLTTIFVGSWLAFKPAQKFYLDLAAAKLEAQITITGPIILGKTCFHIRRASP